MELETINKLYLELSQVATGKTQRELDHVALIKNLSTLVSRLVRLAKLHDLDVATIHQAEAYLRNNNLNGSPLRDIKED